MKIQQFVLTFVNEYSFRALKAKVKKTNGYKTGNSGARQANNYENAFTTLSNRKSLGA